MDTKFTLHAHEQSASADSTTPARVLAEKYAAEGFDFVGFVGHDKRPSVPDDLPVETMTGTEVELRKNPTRVHVLSFPDQDLSILAHPKLSFPKDTVENTRSQVERLGVDAVERFNRGKGQLPPGVGVGVPETASDDAHNTSQVGDSYMVTDAEPTPRAIAAAVKDGNVELRNDPASRMQYGRGRMLQALGVLGKKVRR